jgi:MarR family transcriptional regulator, organic hydroperoxide resistance regulator
MAQLVSAAIVPVARAHRALAATLLARIGLYPGQELLLFQLAEQGGCTQRELADRMRIEPPTVTKMLGRMEQHGLIERSPDPRDARATRVALSAKGYETVTEAQRLWEELERRTIAGLTPDEQATLRVLLGKVSDALYDPQPPPNALPDAPLPSSFMLTRAEPGDDVPEG